MHTVQKVFVGWDSIFLLSVGGCLPGVSTRLVGSFVSREEETLSEELLPCEWPAVRSLGHFTDILPEFN